MLPKRYIFSFLILAALVLFVTAFFSRGVRIAALSIDPQALTRQRIGEIKRFCKPFKRAAGVWPSGTADLLAAFPELKPSTLLDGWGHSFVFYTNLSGGLVVVSLGADGQQGGTCMNADAILVLE